MNRTQTYIPGRASGDRDFSLNKSTSSQKYALLNLILVFTLPHDAAQRLALAILAGTDQTNLTEEENQDGVEAIEISVESKYEFSKIYHVKLVFT
jgi:hypothetical protein